MGFHEGSTRQGNTRPTWWLLYVLAALLVAVVALVEMFVEGAGVRKVLETVTTVGGFGLIGIWLRGNRIALELERGRRRA
jgi:ABC-type antimicrobial peptide transport system permease subunit